MYQDFLISIIIPVYNSKNYIEKCLESLILQTYKNIEIICIDDCSKDGSEKIIEKFAKNDSRIKFFQTPYNSGPATARNIGLNNSYGEFIMFCDSDDFYLPNMCETMANAAKNNDADIVSCKVEVINKELNYKLASYINSEPIGKGKLNNIIKQSITIPLWNKIYKKSIIDKYQIRFPDGISAEDDAFILQYVSAADNYLGLEDVLYNHIFRKTSLVRTLEKGEDENKKFDRIKIIEYVYDFLIKNNLFYSQKEYFEYGIKIQLDYMYLHLKEKCDIKKMILLYNSFVKKAKQLDYSKYNYNTFYKKNFKKAGFLRFWELLKKCYWF